MVVLEARERLGGRVHTYQGAFSCAVDLGAAIITGTQVSVYSLDEIPEYGQRLAKVEPQVGCFTSKFALFDVVEVSAFKS